MCSIWRHRTWFVPQCEITAKSLMQMLIIMAAHLPPPPVPVPLLLPSNKLTNRSWPSLESIESPVWDLPPCCWRVNSDSISNLLEIAFSEFGLKNLRLNENENPSTDGRPRAEETASWLHIWWTGNGPSTFRSRLNAIRVEPSYNLKVFKTELSSSWPGSRQTSYLLRLKSGCKKRI